MRKLLVLLVLCVSCTSWQRRPAGSLSDPELTGRQARITRADGAVFTLHGVRVAGDSLLGFAAHDNSRVAIATADIRTLETREISAGRTAGLGAGVIVGVVVVASAIVVSTLFGSWY